jgi:hypothetical protein
LQTGGIAVTLGTIYLGRADGNVLVLRQEADDRLRLVLPKPEA